MAGGWTQEGRPQRFLGVARGCFLPQSVLGLAVVFAMASFPSLLSAQQDALPAAEGEREIAEAEKAIPEILVTADFRMKEDQDLATSVSVVTSQQIRGRGATHLEEVLALAPNVQLASGASRARFFQIRGIGERGQFESPLISSVALLVDDIEHSGPGVLGHLFDVEQVEVLRGPQGMRYGSNAMAGLINVSTAPPSKDGKGFFKTGISTYDGLFLGAAKGGAITEKLLFRISAFTQQSDGYIRNQHLSRSDTNGINERLGRLRLRWQAASNLTADALLSSVRSTNGYDAFSLDNERVTISDQPGQDIRKSEIFGLRLTWNTSLAVVKALLHAVATDTDYGYDEDWTYPGFHEDGYASVDNYRRDLGASGLEFRLIGQPGTLERLDWLAGVQLFARKEDLVREYTYFPDPFTSAYDTRRFSAFGELDFGLSDSIKLTVGIRAERWRADYADSADARFSPRDTLWGGRLILEWDAGGDAILYSSISRGYKATGFNTGSSLPERLRAFDSETLWNFELGYKRAWLEDRLFAKMALFYMLRRDVQISDSIQIPREDGSAEFVTFVGNAASGRNYGLEAEVRWQAAERLQVWAALGLLSSEYQDFRASVGQVLDGRQQAHAPGYQHYLALEWNLWRRVYARLEGQGRGSFYYSDGHNAKAGAAHWLNLRLSYEGEKFALALWGRNLTNEDIPLRGYFFGNDPRLGYQEKTYVQWAEPLTYGVEFEWFFK